MFVDILEQLAVGVAAFGALGGLVTLAVRKMSRDAAQLGPDAEMRAVKLVPIGKVEPEYLVRVAGVATPAGNIAETMVGKRPFVAYRFELFVPGHSSSLEQRSDGAFYIDDGSGRARVEPPYDVTTLTTRTQGVFSADELPPAVRAFLEEATAGDDWRTSKHLRWIESWVEPGERVCVVGAATLRVDEGGGAGDYRQSAELLTFETADDAPLAISDDPTLLTPPSTS